MVSQPLSVIIVFLPGGTWGESRSAWTGSTLSAAQKPGDLSRAWQCLGYRWI